MVILLKFRSRFLMGSAKRKVPETAAHGMVADMMLAMRHMSTSALDGKSNDQAMQWRPPNTKVETAMTVEITGILSPCIRNVSLRMRGIRFATLVDSTLAPDGLRRETKKVPVVRFVSFSVRSVCSCEGQNAPG